MPELNGCVKLVILKRHIRDVVYYVDDKPINVVKTIREFFYTNSLLDHDWFSKLLATLDNIGGSKNRVGRVLVVNLDYDSRLPAWSYCLRSGENENPYYIRGSIQKRNPTLHQGGVGMQPCTR